jgi:hypothetical protein
MGGASPLNIEGVINRAQLGEGLLRDYPIPLGSWTLDTRAVIGTTSTDTVYRGVAATSMGAIIWDDGATTTDVISLDWVLPGEFVSERNDVNARPSLVLRVKARLTDLTGSATANADLALTATCHFHGVGDAALTSPTAISVVVGAVDYADATEEGFAWYELDLTSTMTAAQLTALAAMDSVSINLSVNEVVGTNLRLDVVGTVLRCGVHVALADTDAR